MHLAFAVFAIFATTALGQSCSATDSGVPGIRIKHPSRDEVYLIDPEGFRRHIPNEATYNRLFRTRDNIQSNTTAACIKLGPPLDVTETRLVKSRESGNYYLADKPVPKSSLVTYRWIVSLEVFDRYNFKSENAANVSQTQLDQSTDFRFWG
jgi:hypothetical protein